jgi:hypothetical protein
LALTTGAPRPWTERQPRSASTRMMLWSFSAVMRTWLKMERVIMIGPRAICMRAWRKLPRVVRGS